MAAFVEFPLIASVVVLLLTFTFLRLWNNKKLPPGPWGLPLLGYYPFLSSTPHQDFTYLSKKYGEVFCFRSLGGRLFVVLNGSKAIKEVLVNRADEFSSRPPGTSLISWVSDGLGISQEDGVPWKEQRRFFLHSARSFGFGRIETEIRIQDEIRQLFSDVQQSGEDETHLELRVGYLTNSVICHLLFSRKLEKEVFFQELLPELRHVVRLFVGNMHLAVGKMLDLTLMLSRGMGIIQNGIEKLRNFTDVIVDDHIRSFDPGHQRDFVDAVLLHRQERLAQKVPDESSFTIERLKANAFNLFVEGTESVGFTTSSLLLELAKHLDVQKKVQQELDGVLGKERMLSWNDRQSLPLLEATIQELFRFSAPFLISTMYANDKDTTINGYHIPRHSSVVANFGSTHFDPIVFPRPLEFRPERFLNSEGKRVRLDGPYPYGVGKRQCIGESLAQMEVFLIVGAFLQTYTLFPGSREDMIKLVLRQ